MATPRAVLTDVVENNRIAIALLFLYLASIDIAFFTQTSHVANETSVGTLVGRVALIGVSFGALMYVVMIATFNLVATWFGGTGDFGRTLVAFGWSAFPYAIGAVLTILCFPIFGRELLQHDRPRIEGDVALSTAFAVYDIVKWALILWHHVLLVIALSVAHKLSTFTSFVVLFIVTVLIVGVFGWFAILVFR